jgi:ABC-type sugar transport system ATPase subunit
MHKQNRSPVIKVTHLSKTFGNVEALRDVNLEIYAGEILAIVGDNGAGKSTLIKILAGALTADSGAITIGERNYRSISPSQAIRLGIATVYQDLALVDCRDVVSNVFLGREPNEAKEAIKAGKLDGSIAYSMDAYAKAGILLSLKTIQGMEVPPQVNSPLAVVTKENIKEYENWH